MPRSGTLAYNKVMPSKDTIREYKQGGVYHIYNRGINKQNIFLDSRDYSTFLFYLKLYLDNPENLKDFDPQKRKYLNRKNFYKTISLLCFCLMPNHYHLVLRQVGERDISEFMGSVMLNYSMYFNSRHKRVGPLFQGKYRAVLVKNDNYLLHLSRYIHLNPFIKNAEENAKVRNLSKELLDYDYSSYLVYLGKKNIKWVNPEFILNYFEENKDQDMIKESSYQEFIKDYKYGSKEILGDLAIEKD